MSDNFFESISHDPFPFASVTDGTSQEQVVRKRDGSIVPVSFDEITLRLTELAKGLFKMVDPLLVAHRVIRDMPDEIIETKKLDELACKHAAALVVKHPAYAIFAARIAVSNHHKNTIKHGDFYQTMKLLYENNGKTHEGKPVCHIDERVYQFIEKHAKQLDEMIDYRRDFNIKYSGFMTLKEKYLLRVAGEPVERMQHVFMRIAVQFYYPMDFDESSDDSLALKEIKTCYETMSSQLYTHASPTIFNAGTPFPRLASCYLLNCADSVEGMYSDFLSACAIIAKGAGGIGANLGNIRALGSTIHSTERAARGVFRFLKVLNEFVKHIDQGGKRQAAAALYFPAWHPEIFRILDSKKENTIDENRTKYLFYSMWISDLFMQRVEADEKWTLMCPDGFPGLQDVYGEEFVQKYENYEKEIIAGQHEDKVYKVIRARELWEKIIEAQIETGTPYMVYKDNANRKNNQSNLGTLTNSNLCTEILEYCSPDEIAVCNLASLTLPKFVKYYDDTKKPYFDFALLRNMTGQLVRNLNRAIDRMYYDLEQTKKSNLSHRPIGIGVTGLADVFAMMRYPFDSDEARHLNKQIFENIYYAALSASCELASTDGTYPSYNKNGGSPISKGKLQFDLWADCGHFDHKNLTINTKEWDSLRSDIKKHGVRNSLLVAPMPTASTSFLMGYTECFEPRQSNIFRRDTSIGNFIVCNEYMVFDLMKLNLWEKLRDQIENEGGSIQSFEEIPEDIRKLHRTVWEIRQTALAEMAADRGPFIDQTQSFNLHVESPNTAKMSTIHFKTWKLGLKTGQYYLRSQDTQSAVRIAARSNIHKTGKNKQTVVKKDEKSEKSEEAKKSSKFTSTVT